MVERYPYRFPFWLSLLGALAAYLFWVAGSGAPAVARGLTWLLSGSAALVVVAPVVSHLRRIEVVLTEHHVTAAAPLRRTVRIDFSAVDRLETRMIASPVGQRHGIFEIHTPDQKIALWDKGFRNRDIFDQAVATVAERVAAHGGPEISSPIKSRFRLDFVA